MRPLTRHRLSNVVARRLVRRMEPTMFISKLAAIAAVFTASPALAGEGHDHAAPKPASSDGKVAVARCEHGVASNLCTRCNPKLAAVYKAKGDWCPEHARPESQCVLCHPELRKQGVK
jgi:hypothetical protein